MEKKYVDNLNQQIKIWELKDLPLGSLIDRTKLLPDGFGKFIILNNNEAKSVYSYLDEVIDLNVFVIEDSKVGVKKYYALFARPLLPYEIPGELYMSTIPAPSTTKPNFNLTCYPSDGILPISITIP
jgi:hypothetical protein